MSHCAVQKVEIGGGCHCQAVRFIATVKTPTEVQLCNCSICRMCGFEHLIVPASRFQLVKGEGVLLNYQFGSMAAGHLFCGICGIKSFYVPRSNPDGFSLNVRCLDKVDQLEIVRSEFDGRNWTKNAHALKHLSEE